MSARSRGTLALGAGVGLVAFLVACGSGDEPLESNNVVNRIPWPATETAVYSVTQDDIEGECVLTIEVTAAGAEFAQACEAEEFTDTVTVTAQAESLRPGGTIRTITGPEGEVTCEAAYSASDLNVRWTSPDDEREDMLDLPQVYYESWADVFLWRTINFGEGYDMRYIDVASCTNPRAQPELVGVRLTVDETERVEVPAGTYETWHLEIRSEGHTQDAWYATDDNRTLVKYDNGDQVFELVSVE